ncbi:MAG: hypothetical protein AAFY20_04505 [Cyanobacteria bacterium J06639_14]
MGQNPTRPSELLTHRHATHGTPPVHQNSSPTVMRPTAPHPQTQPVSLLRASHPRHGRCSENSATRIQKFDPMRDFYPWGYCRGGMDN